ncbi:MAG: hypothetical protein HS111_02155 [Kofleriaceae bacterium]|nr:hypothetical protein [Kofleriaceae bacterium]MCL4223011.1 hypothetical protein [Myxococcales bacterium]
MRRPGPPVTALAAALAAAGTLAAASTAAASPQPCAAAEADTIDVDGMLDDWTGVAKVRVGGTAPDASFDLRCLFDGQRLYLAVDVRDEHLVRAGKTPAGEDRVELVLTAGKAPLTIVAYPGKDRVAPRRLVGGKPAPAWLVVEDTLQPRGWSVELAVPLARLAGWGPSVPAVSATVTFHDADVPRLSLTESTLPWSGQLGLGDAGSLLDQVLAELKLRPGQLTLDATAELDPSRAGPERVVAGGTALALLTDRYALVRLPAARAADVLRVELVDLAGDGRRHVAVALRQHGGGGSRDLLLLFEARDGKLAELRTVEIGKAQGGRKLASTWVVESAKAWQKQARGARRVLVVRAGPAVGWDEDSFAEAPAPDADPIHVPWDDDRHGAVYWLDKGGLLASAPLRR